MTTTQENYIGMFLRVKLWFVKYAITIAAIPDAAAILERLEDYLTDIFNYAGEGSADESGTTDRKTEVRLLLNTQAILVAAGATAYAVKNKLKELKNKIDFADTDFNRSSGKTVIANVTLLLTHVKPINDKLGNFGVTAADFETLQTLLTSFIELEQAPSTAIDNRSLQNDQLEATIVLARTMLSEELDVYLKPQAIKNPLMHTAYQAARLLDAIGTRVAPDATVTVGANSLAVLYNKQYEANRLFYITNDGPEIVEISISETATTPGTKIIVIGKGDTRQRTTYNLATSGNYLLVRNLGASATQIRLWVEE
jgi:hypothetical protein